MSQETIEIVRRSFEAFARGDFDAAFSAYDASIKWRTAADEPDQRTYRGIEEVGDFVGSLADPWADRFEGVMEFEAMIDGGNFVVVPWRARVQGRGSGIGVDLRETYVVHVLGGKIVGVEEYRSTEQALEAVGLSQ
jgi:ketosteroid isomerase-like protein